MSSNMADRLKRQMMGGPGGKLTPKNVTAMLLFGAICLVFVFFGLPGRMGAGVGAVGRVNNSLISLADFQQEEERIQQYYTSLFGGSMDLSSQRQLLRQQALETLVRRELVSQATQAEGILATDAEVRDFIVKDIPIFQQNGQFQREIYGNYLEMTHSNPADFEGKVRKDIENIRSRRLFELTGKPMAAEEAKLKALRETKMNVAFARIQNDQVMKQMNISEADAQKALADAAFLKKAQENFEANKASYEQKEEVHAEHILIAAKQGDPASQAAALKKIEEIRKEADKEDFGKLAAKYSEDPGSKVKKGDLGFFERGRMVKEFEDVAFSLPVGKVSEPVRTPFGYHLIKVVEKKEAKPANFDALKIKVAQNLLAREKLEAKLSDMDEALTKGDEAKVSADLKALGVSWDETGFFEIGAEALPKIQSPVVRESVYELNSSQPLLNHLVRDGNFKYVLKLKDQKTETAALSPTDEQAIQRRRADGMYDAWLNQFRKNSRVELNAQVLQQQN